MYNLASIIAADTQVSTNNMVLATIMGVTAGQHLEPQLTAATGIAATDCKSLPNGKNLA